MLAWLQRAPGNWCCFQWGYQCVALTFVSLEFMVNCKPEGRYACQRPASSSTIIQQIISLHTLPFWSLLHAPPTFLPSFSSSKAGYRLWGIKAGCAPPMTRRTCWRAWLLPSTARPTCRDGQDQTCHAIALSCTTLCSIGTELGYGSQCVRGGSFLSKPGTV